MSVNLYDVHGRLVRRLSRHMMAKERLVTTWRGEDERGKQVAAGIYLLRARVGSHVRTQKLVW